MKTNGAEIEGIQVLLCTPMTHSGMLDFESTFRLVDHVIDGGVDGIILLGSTGEFFSISESERREFVERVIPYVNGRVPVGVCPGLSGTETTVALAEHAERAGADYLLVPVPFYFANTMNGVIDFFTRVARCVTIPVMPYDGGGGNSLDLETWRRIVAANKNVNLAKVTVPLPPKIKWLNQEFEGQMAAFGGSDQTILLSLANGAKGLTVAGANVVPHRFAELWSLYSTGQRQQARNVYYRQISPMNVITVPAHTEFIQCYKQALYWMGVIETPVTRGPMMPLDEARKQELQGALEWIGVPLLAERVEQALTTAKGN